MNWMQKISQSEDYLFHGTGEPIEGDLQPMSHGGILWMAETPDVAQNYIPITGLTVFYGLPTWQMDSRVQPNKGFDQDLLRQMGYNPETMKIKYDYMGHANSYVIHDGHPTYKDVQKFLADLGYGTPKNGRYRLRIGDDNEIMPADYKAPGTLFIFTGRSKLKILDLTGGSGEDDLMDPTYNKIGLFRKAEEQGYDGVRINDFAQSDRWGNMGHVSLGIFASGLAKLKQDRIEARNFDWGDNLQPTDTDEFLEWKRRGSEL